MVIHVLDQEFNLVGIIDNYISVIWTTAYYGIGDFELYLDATDKALNLLRENRYIVRDTDISVDSSGVATYKNVMIIKNITLKTDVENGDFLTVTGRELKYLLHQRIVWGQTTLTNDTAEYGLRRLVGVNAINPVEPTRTIPNMQHGAVKGFTEPIDKQVSNVQLDEAVIDICKTYNYGWDIYITAGKLTFDIYKGVDRSYNQSERPYVVFSEKFDNLFGSEYVLNTENYANMTRIGGEGEGLDRTYAYINPDIEGLDRYEIFTDAKDISQNLDSEDAISYEDYILLLEERGRENLAEKIITEGFTGEIINGISFNFGVDFNLGDTVTVINEYGMLKNVRVLSVIESVDDSGTKVIPQFII